MPISGNITRISFTGDIMRGMGHTPFRERIETKELRAGCLLLICLSEGVTVFETT